MRKDSSTGGFPSRADPPSPEGVIPSRSGRLLRLAVCCPRCGSRPALRLTEELLRGLGGGIRIGTYQCQRRGCGTIYDLHVDERLLRTELGGAV